MVASVGILACVAAIAAAVKLAALEYNRLRKIREMNQALRLSLGQLA